MLADTFVDVGQENNFKQGRQDQGQGSPNDKV